MKARAGWIWALLLGLPAQGSPPADWPLSGAMTCVAYRAHKDTLFSSNVVVLGQNCGVSVQVERDATAERARVLITAPVEGFDSGSGRRDRHVAEILGGAERAPLVFTSDWFAANAIIPLRAGESAVLGGELRIRGVSQPVILQVSASPAGAGTTLRARAATTFAALGVTVPSVGPGGMIAQPKEDVELLGQIPLTPELLASLVTRRE